MFSRILFGGWPRHISEGRTLGQCSPASSANDSSGHMAVRHPPSPIFRLGANEGWVTCRSGSMPIRHLEPRRQKSRPGSLFQGGRRSGPAGAGPRRKGRGGDRDADREPAGAGSVGPNRKKSGPAQCRVDMANDLSPSRHCRAAARSGIAAGRSLDRCRKRQNCRILVKGCSSNFIGVARACGLRPFPGTPPAPMILAGLAQIKPHCGTSLPIQGALARDGWAFGRNRTGPRCGDALDARAVFGVRYRQRASGERKQGLAVDHCYGAGAAPNWAIFFFAGSIIHFGSGG